MGNIFSNIWDAIGHLLGFKKDRQPPPHKDYWSPYQGYFADNRVLIRGVGIGLDSALSRVSDELNRGAKEAGLPYTFATTTAPGETILVQWDTTGKVGRGEDGTTPPTETIGVRPDIPQAVAHATIYIRQGKSGDYLYRLILHEVFAHARTHMGVDGHSNDSRDVGSPECKASSLSAADLATWIKTMERRRQDGLG